jgi:hypothetical protein
LTLAEDACQRVTLVAEKVCKLFCRGDYFADDWGVVHDTAQAVRDDRSGEGKTAAGDPIWRVARLSHPCVTVSTVNPRAASKAVHLPHGGVTDSVPASRDQASRIDAAAVAYVEASSSSGTLVITWGMPRVVMPCAVASPRCAVPMRCPSRLRTSSSAQGVRASSCLTWVPAVSAITQSSASK